MDLQYLSLNPHLRIYLSILVREEERERNMDRLPLIGTPSWDGTHNLGLCLNLGWNLQPANFPCMRGGSNQPTHPARADL